MSSSPEEEIRRTIAEFCHHTDAGRFDEWVDLFTEDGSIHLLGRTATGRDELRAFIEMDQPPGHRGIHLTTDSVITIRGDVAEVSSKFAFIAAGEAAGVVVAAGVYEDILVPDGDRWRFRRRQALPFSRTATQPWGVKDFPELAS